MASSTITVTTQAQLNAAIQQIDAQTAPGNTVIELAATITEGASGQPAGLYALDVSAGKVG